MKNNSFTNRAIVNCKVFSFNKNWNILAIKKTTFMLVILMLLSFSIFLVAGKNLTTTSTNQTYQLSSYNADENNYSEPTNQTNKTKITEEKSKNETLLVSIDKVINETLKIEEKTENLTKLNKTFAQQNLTSSNNLTQLNLTQKKQESNNSEEIKTENKNDKPKTRSSVIKKSTISKAVNKSSDKKNEVNQTKEKIKLICYKNSEKSFEGKVDKNIDCHQIEKKEIESGDKKRVIIKSDKHIEDSIIIYTDIPEIPKNKKSAVKIYWKNNNNKEITQINFYDKNNNGLFDRISWVVPHLSEQIFEIIINFTTHTLSSEIEINVTSPKQGEVVKNPIEFKIDINYTNLSNLNCHLFIDSKYPETINFSVENKSIIWPHDLKDGPHNWIVECIDINTSNKKAVNGTFIINESYCVQLNNKIYLLNDTEEIKINISSKNNANVTIELTNPDNTIHKLVSNEQISSPYIINRSLITKRGLYKVNISFNNLKKPYSIIKNFSVVELQLTLNNNEITTNEEINITLAICSPIEPISSATLYFGDGDEKTFNNIGSTDFTKTIAHSYEEPGDYTLNLTANIDERWFTIKKNGIHVNSSENGRDDEDPEIELISPEDNAVIHTQEIFFSYRATDNVKVANCTFELYNNSGPFGSLEYSQTNTNISNNEIITIRLSQFEEAEYSWRVECCDNSSNCAAKIRDFTISLNTSLLMDNLTYEHQEEVEEAISNLEEFLIKKESYDLEKLEVLDDLGISEDLTYFQKRLPQIKIDLSNNLKYLTNESLREERKKEILEEFFEIKEKIPLDVSIVDKKEFVKNSVPANLEGIIKQYLEEKNIYKRNLKSLINLNRELQKNIKVRTKVRQVKIEYPNETKEITLVTKKIELKNKFCRPPKRITLDAVSG